MPHICEKAAEINTLKANPWLRPALLAGIGLLALPCELFAGRVESVEAGANGNAPVHGNPMTTANLRTDGAAVGGPREFSMDATQSITVDSPNETSRLLAQSCTGCHGDAPASTIPAINNMPAAALQRTLIAFKRGTRPNTVMARIARGYSDQEVKLLATEIQESRGR